MTSESVREVADRLNEIDAATLYEAADEIERLQSDRQSLIDELFRVRELITGQEDYDIVTQLLKDMGENTGGDE